MATQPWKSEPRKKKQVKKKLKKAGIATKTRKTDSRSGRLLEATKPKLVKVKDPLPGGDPFDL